MWVQRFLVNITQDLQQRQSARQQDFPANKFQNLQDGLVNKHLCSFIKNQSKKMFQIMYLEVFKGTLMQI